MTSDYRVVLSGPGWSVSSNENESSDGEPIENFAQALSSALIMASYRLPVMIQGLALVVQEVLDPGQKDPSGQDTLKEIESAERSLYDAAVKLFDAYWELQHKHTEAKSK